jgi:hypothetical protein
MAKKEINVYYKGVKQTIKYYGNFDEKNIKSVVKQTFKIQESLEQIFFQDEDGDILALDEQTPSGISIYIYVEPDAFPKNPCTELKIPEKSEKLLKFHWILENDIEQHGVENLNVIIGKYIYKTVNGNDIHPGVRSSCSFEKGKHFFVLRKSILGAYTALAITKDDNNSSYSRENSIGIFDGYPEENYTIFAKNLGIYIDMDKKKCIFYDYDKKEKYKIIYYTSNNSNIEAFEAPILCQKVKLVAWLKRDACSHKEGITILNEGCIPIPDWVKNDNK